jgi:hypothetical protein
MKFARVIVFNYLLFISVSAMAQPEAGSHPFLKNLFDTSPLFDTTRTLKKAAAVAFTDSATAWRQWQVVENYSYGKNRGPLPMIADLDALHPYFRDKIVALMASCEKMGIRLAIVESYRTPAKQAEYYAMGRKYTRTPGGKSRHQYGLAIDVVPIVDSVAVWDNHRLWRKIGLTGERLGLRWGGRWRVLYDPGHFEWTGGLSRQSLAKGDYPLIPAAARDLYPDIRRDLEQLQSYWEAWGVEQSMMARRGNAPGEPVAGAGH